MNLVPLFDRVLVKREELKTGRILIPETAKDRNAPHIGIIQAVGPSCEHDPKLKVGDRVIWGQHSGATLRVDGQEFYVVAENDIIAKVEDPLAAERGSIAKAA